MSTARARTSEPRTKEPKREAILEAALELFAARGFHGTAVPLVAEKAKVGAGTIYRYFESKEALVNALYQQEKRDMLTSLLEEFPHHEPPREQFRIFFHRMAAYAVRRPLAVRFLELHHHAPYLDAASRQIEEQGNMMIESALHAGIAVHAIKELPTKLLFAIVLGIFGGLLRAWTDGHIELDDEATLKSAEQCCWEAIQRRD